DEIFRLDTRGGVTHIRQGRRMRCGRRSRGSMRRMKSAPDNMLSGASCHTAMKLYWSKTNINGEEQDYATRRQALSDSPALAWRPTGHRAEAGRMARGFRAHHLPRHSRSAGQRGAYRRRGRRWLHDAGGIRATAADVHA